MSLIKRFKVIQKPETKYQKIKQWIAVNLLQWFISPPYILAKEFVKAKTRPLKHRMIEIEEIKITSKK